ncbi:peptidoglycan-binding domain-containing protein [Streptomyces sp. NPDC052052]|uniref:peptidoglycan-binding domain-containing protein n=1 Tax=Streptomyces sp. NPDC052052 TaxID=3154756 RepID=UPI0034361D16
MCGEQTKRRAAAQQHAAEQRRAERAAEMAAAEDFDPLRIRPYVTLGGDEAPTADDEAESHHRPAQDAATTMQLRPVTAGPLPDAVEPAGALAATAPEPGPTLPYAPADDPVQPRRRRPYAVLAVGAAVAAVVGAAAFVGGLFEGHGNGDVNGEQTLPSTVASAPDASTPAQEPASASASPSPSATASVSPSVSPSPTASTSPSPSASASRSAAASPAASAAATAATSPSVSTAPPATLTAPTLRLGDQGPEVAELQRRLEELWLFHGQDDGNFTNQVERAVRVYQSYKAIEGDPLGVYGPLTRRALEAETTGQGRS